MKLPYVRSRVRLTSPFGERADPFDGTPEFHGGVDLVGLDDKRIVAVQSGRVAFSGSVADKSTGGRTWEWGEYIRIDTADGKYKHYYCHLGRRFVEAGQYVGEGDVIGVEGTSGNVTGRHLHFEVREYSPVKRQLNAAEYLGIPNKTGEYPPSSAERASGGMTTEAYRAEVTAAAGIEPQTVEYLNAYKYADDLWRKLYGMLGRG